MIHKDTIEVFLPPSDSKTNFHQLPVWEVHKLELSGIYNSQMSLFEAVGLQTKILQKVPGPKVDEKSLEIYLVSKFVGEIFLISFKEKDMLA